MEKIICNPLKLEYRYQTKKSLLGTGVFREAADPTVVVFQNTYYLFASMSGGFWYSDDLYDWHYKATPELPVYDYAPDVRVVNGKVVFCASKRKAKCSIFYSADPLEQPFQAITAPMAFWDPNIFQDDNGKVYLYWGCSTREPIWGVELDAETMQPIGKKTAVVGEMEAVHGWERVGEDNKLAPPKSFGDRLIRLALGTKPCIEGAYMTKHQGRYYLQYAAPGTEHNVYSDGVYLGDDPLGPFTYQVHNPFSSKPGGFIAAAGHGSTFQDKQGRWWHASTMRISVNDNYERRIGLFPCDFDKDGILFCNQNFADYPLDLCKPDAGDRMTRYPEWMLLSYRTETACSSAQTGYEAGLSVDESIQTHWASVTDDLTEWLMLDLNKIADVRVIQINFADHKLSIPKLKKKHMVKENIGYRKIHLEKQLTGYILEGSVDKKHWTVLKDNRADLTDFTHDLVVLSEVTSLRYLRLRNMTMAMGGVPAVSGLRVFGLGDGPLPEKASQLRIERKNELNVFIAWQPSPGATGYNIRYGPAPDKLYASWQVYHQTTLDLSMINKGSPCFVAVDSYNESGVTPGDVVQIYQ